MFGGALRRVISEAQAYASSFDGDCLLGADAAEVVRLCVEGERALASIRLAATRQVEATMAYAAAGHQDAASWAASAVGVAKSEAVAMVATARQLDDLPQTALALRSRLISAGQATSIAKAGPGANETALLGVATTQSVSVLDEQCRRAKASSSQRNKEILERQRRERKCQIRTRSDGTVSIWAILLPEEGARFAARHRANRELIFRTARKSGRYDSGNQYDADALMSLVDTAGETTTGTKSKIATTVNVIVDHSALVRGHRGPGETSEVPGIGEIPIFRVKAMMADCLLRTLVVKGHDVVAATSPTRTIPASVKAALVYRDQR